MTKDEKIIVTFDSIKNFLNVYKLSKKIPPIYISRNNINIVFNNIV